mmetsp:Transcript_54211/g.96165  ORF Transcript_54211/g.96165 Transcript_54211/m.96165 type:complete len:208 (-) Transcript_54211:67-690(-)
MGMGGMGGMDGMGGMMGMGGMGNMQMMANNMAMMANMGMMGNMAGMAGMDGMGCMGALPDNSAESEQMREQLQKQREEEYSKQMAVIAAGAARVEEKEEEVTSYGTNKTNSNHPEYRPPNMETIPGLTDRRFKGVISFWHNEQGFGFIKCPKLSKRFPNHDIFLHRNQKVNFEEGETCTFGVFLNFRGRPQATCLRRPRPGDEADDD